MKKTLLTLCALSGALLLSACTAGPDMTTATNSPNPTESAMFPDMLPQSTGMMNGVESVIDNAGDMVEDVMDGPRATAVPEAAGVTSMDTARRAVEQIEDELERLSEVDDAQVVIAGNKAAVALEFDNQYRGGIDDRLRGIVKERIDSVINGISTVAITADESLMDALEALGDRMDGMNDMSTLQGDLDAIIRRINTQT